MICGVCGNYYDKTKFVCCPKCNGIENKGQMKMFINEENVLDFLSKSIL